MKHDLWVEEYRPNSLEEYVWRDVNQKEQISAIIKSGKIPNLLLTGQAGLGKTSLAKVILKELKVDPSDVLEINGSTETGVDTVREKITSFVSIMGFGGMRYVLFDEFDFMSVNAQAALRNLIENSSKSARFILTGNYPKKIIPAIKSRCQHFHFTELDKEEFILRVASVLEQEEVKFDVDLLSDFIEATYPDLRKCINLLQQYSVNGELKSFDREDAGEPEWYEPMIELFAAGKINEARKLIVSHITQDEFENMYRFLYDNLQYFGRTEEEQMEAILIIREGLVNHSLCADSEINFSATVCKLSMIGK